MKGRARAAAGRCAGGGHARARCVAVRVSACVHECRCRTSNNIQRLCCDKPPTHSPRYMCLYRSASASPASTPRGSTAPGRGGGKGGGPPRVGLVREGEGRRWWPLRGDGGEAHLGRACVHARAHCCVPDQRRKPARAPPAAPLLPIRIRHTLTAVRVAAGGRALDGGGVDVAELVVRHAADQTVDALLDGSRQWIWVIALVVRHAVDQTADSLPLDQSRRSKKALVWSASHASCHRRRC